MFKIKTKIVVYHNSEYMADWGTIDERIKLQDDLKQKIRRTIEESNLKLNIDNIEIVFDKDL